MAKIVAQGQVTITDLYDMPAVTSFISSNQAKVQTMSYLSDTAATLVYNPDWSKTTENLQLNVSLFTSGNSTDRFTDANYAQLSNVSWSFVIGSGAKQSITHKAGDMEISGTKNSILTIKQNKLDVANAAHSGIKFIAEFNYTYPGIGTAVPMKCEIDIVAIKPVEETFSVVSSNDNFSIVTDASDKVLNQGAQTCTFAVYRGATAYTGNSVSLSNVVLGNGVSNITTSITNDTLTINMTQGTALSDVSGTISVDVKIMVRSVEKKFTKVLTWTKTKQGANGTSGTDAVVTWIQAEPNALVFNSNTNAYRTGLTLKSYERIGSGASNPKNALQYKLQKSSNGGASWSDVTITSGAQNSITVTAAGLGNSSTVNLFRAGIFSGSPTADMSGAIDVQVIPVVVESPEPITIALSAPFGTVFRNSLINEYGDQATAVLSVIKNGSDIASSLNGQVKWYLNDVLDTISTNKTYPVSPDMFLNTGTIKVEVIVDGRTYRDQITFTDYTDPIQPIILASNGTVFKDATSSTNLTCDLWAQDTQIDISGNKYFYSWTKRDKDGVIVSFSPVPSTISSGARLGTGIVTAINTTSKTITLSAIPDGLKVGQKIRVTNDSNWLTISAINTGTKIITYTFTGTLPAVTTGASSFVDVLNYKTITVAGLDVSQKASYTCEVYEP